MAILGTPTEIVLLLLLSIIMSIGLPIYFGLKFDWDPAEVEADVEASTDYSESQAATERP